MKVGILLPADSSGSSFSELDNYIIAMGLSAVRRPWGL